MVNILVCENANGTYTIAELEVDGFTLQAVTNQSDNDFQLEIFRSDTDFSIEPFAAAGGGGEASGDD